MRDRRQWAAVALAAVAVLASPKSLRAENICPENAIRLVSPFPAGGPTDVAARIVAEKLKERIGQNVIVENRAGAGGATGTGYVAQQPGNGCTMLLSYDSHAVNPVLLNLPFDTATAFKPVVMIGTIPNMIAAHPAQPYKTFAEMVAEAKKEPDRLAYATGGTGTVGHLSMKQIEQHYGMQLRNVPYRGGAPAAADLDRRPCAADDGLGAGARQIRAGRQGPRAGATRPRSATRCCPTRRRSDEIDNGMKGFSSVSWMGIFVPAATPDATVARFHDEIAALLNDSWAKERWSRWASQLNVGTSAELGAFVKSEMARWGDVVKRYNIKVE